jgi:NAD(P)-dependent dehydrogenase (short-subunit alcohol dehydrogenase family)/acyl dehydratase
MTEPRLFRAEDLATGLHAEFERDITAEDIAAFAELSRDWNPLHTDEEYASHTNYGRRIVHGAFQVGLASAMAGMYLPGREVVVAGFQCRFPAPLHYPSTVRVRGEIIAWAQQTLSGSLRVRVTEVPAGVLTSEIHVGFSLHETRAAVEERVEEREEAAVRPDTGHPIAILTGAGGGLGRTIAETLAQNYHVIGLGRSRPSGFAEWISGDLASGNWEKEAERVLGGRLIYALVHAAWPAGPQGGLLEANLDDVRAQLEFGGAGAIRIARFVRLHAEPAGARLVVLSSTAATLKPALNMSSYSLGKAVLEHAVTLLAPELARANITINAIAPSFVPAGMNAAKTNRVILTETAKVPLGKLCSAADTAAAVQFFLSPGAAFVTGQMLALTGGQL